VQVEICEEWGDADMTYADMDGMTLIELRDYKQKLSGRITALNRKIQKRKEYLKATRYPGYEPSVKNDPEIMQMKIELAEVSNEMSSFKEYRRLRENRVKVEEAKADLELHRIELEKMQFDAENRDFIDQRNAKASERRPGGPNVWFGPEFNNIKGAEKRLIVMMAREIGQARYQELKRIAYWDEHHRNNRYYTGDDKFDGRKGLF